MDPFAPKFQCLIQNNISENIYDALNFVTCEQTTYMTAQMKYQVATVVVKFTYINP